MWQKTNKDCRTETYYIEVKQVIYTVIGRKQNPEMSAFFPKAQKTTRTGAKAGGNGTG